MVVAKSAVGSHCKIPPVRALDHSSSFLQWKDDLAYCNTIAYLIALSENWQSIQKGQVRSTAHENTQAFICVILASPHHDLEICVFRFGHEQDVLRLKIAVKNPKLVQVPKPRGNLRMHQPTQGVGVSSQVTKRGPMQQISIYVHPRAKYSRKFKLRHDKQPWGLEAALTKQLTTKKCLKKNPWFSELAKTQVPHRAWI